jgi:hypothetical protein
MGLATHSLSQLGSFSASTVYMRQNAIHITNEFVSRQQDCVCWNWTKGPVMESAIGAQSPMQLDAQVRQRSIWVHWRCHQ